MPNEIELKLAIRSKDIPRLLEQPILKAHAPHVQHDLLINHYFDTPQLSLRQRKVALRIREIGDQKIQTLKTAGQAQAGMHQRKEWEFATNLTQPDLSLIDDEYLQHWFETEGIQAQLQSIFTTDFTRTAYLIAFQNSQIELAIDQGEVRFEQLSDPICEVELELKEGDINDLFELALVLAEHVPLRLYNTSKAQRGYRLFSDEKMIRVPNPLPAVPVVSSHSVFEAFQLALGHYISHWQLAEEAFLTDPTLEHANALAQTVYAIKRAFNYFSKLIPKKVSSEIRAELNWFAETLEWLIPSHEMHNVGLSYAAFTKLYHRMPLIEDIRELLVDELQTEQDLIAQITQSIYSARYGQLLLSLSQWVFLHDWEGYLKPESEKALTKSIKSFCDNQLQKYWHELASIFSPQHELDSHAYCDQVDRLLNIMLISSSWSALYEQERMDDFMDPWIDLQAGMIDLDIIYQIRGLSSQLTDEKTSQMYEWLDSQEECLMHAMLQTRRAMSQQEAYWP